MLNEEIKKYFEKIYDKPLSEKELTEVISGLVGFFEFIIKFSNEDDARKPQPKNK